MHENGRQDCLQLYPASRYRLSDTTFYVEKGKIAQTFYKTESVRTLLGLPREIIIKRIRPSRGDEKELLDLFTNLAEIRNGFFPSIQIEKTTPLELKSNFMRNKT